MLQTDEPDDFVWRPGASFTVCEFARARVRACRFGLAAVFDQRYLRPTEGGFADRRRDKAAELLGWRNFGTDELARMVDAVYGGAGVRRQADRQADRRPDMNAHTSVRPSDRAAGLHRRASRPGRVPRARLRARGSPTFAGHAPSDLTRSGRDVHDFVLESGRESSTRRPGSAASATYPADFLSSASDQVSLLDAAAAGCRGRFLGSSCICPKLARSRSRSAAFSVGGPPTTRTRDRPNRRHPCGQAIMASWISGDAHQPTRRQLFAVRLASATRHSSAA